MATSGATSFNLDLSSLVEEAFERCGAEMRSGYDLRTARRSLNLLLIEWANRGLNLWTVEQGEIALLPGQAEYPLPEDTVDLLDHVVRQYNGTRNQTDITISRISSTTYSTIPNKLTQGRPIQVWVDRQINPRIFIWPTPEGPDGTYTMVYWRLRRMQDAGSGVNTQDIPFRFLTCLVAGLAYYLSMKLPGVDPTRVQMLKIEYEEQWQRASEEDREKAPLRIVPYLAGM